MIIKTINKIFITINQIINKWITMSSKIKILSYHTIDDDIKYNKYSSDHYPVMVEALLKWEKE